MSTNDSYENFEASDAEGLRVFLNNLESDSYDESLDLEDEHELEVLNLSEEEEDELEFHEESKPKRNQFFHGTGDISDFLRVFGYGPQERPPVMSDEETIRLSKQLKSSVNEIEQKDLTEKLIRGHLLLIIKETNKYSKNGTMRFRDLCGYAISGFVEGIESLRPELLVKTGKVSPFLVNYIRNALKDARRENHEGHVLSNYFFAKKMKIMRLLKLGLTKEEICEKENLSFDQFDGLISTYISLQQTVNEDETVTVEQLIEDEKSCSPDSNLLSQEISADIKNVVNVLPEREKEILLKYNDKDFPNADLAKKYNITISRVQQIYKETSEKVFKKLKKKQIIA